MAKHIVSLVFFFFFFFKFFFYIYKKSVNFKMKIEVLTCIKGPIVHHFLCLLAMLSFSRICGNWSMIYIYIPSSYSAGIDHRILRIFLRILASHPQKSILSNLAWHKLCHKWSLLKMHVKSEKERLPKNKTIIEIWFMDDEV